MTGAGVDWRSRLKRDIGWLLMAKLGFLTLLWAVFFSGSHRCRADASATANRMALAGRPAAHHVPIANPGGDRCD